MAARAWLGRRVATSKVYRRRQMTCPTVVLGHHASVCVSRVPGLFGQNGTTPLLDACSRGDTPIVKQLLAVPGILLDVPRSVRR